jgi:hypothetical protein
VGSQIWIATSQVGGGIFKILLMPCCEDEIVPFAGEDVAKL